MKTAYTPGPWKMEIYLNEKDAQQPPHIIGLGDNHQVADCCGADDMAAQGFELLAPTISHQSDNPLLTSHF